MKKFGPYHYESHLNRRRPYIGTLFFGVDVELGQGKWWRKSKWEERILSWRWKYRVGVSFAMIEGKGAILFPWRNDNVGEFFSGLEKSTEISSISNWISSITFLSDFTSKSSVVFQIFSFDIGSGSSKNWSQLPNHFSRWSARVISTKIVGAKWLLQRHFTWSYPFDQSKIIKWKSLPPETSSFSLSLTEKRPSNASTDWLSPGAPLK